MQTFLIVSYFNLLIKQVLNLFLKVQIFHRLQGLNINTISYTVFCLRLFWKCSKAIKIVLGIPVNWNSSNEINRFDSQNLWNSFSPKNSINRYGNLWRYLKCFYSSHKKKTNKPNTQISCRTYFNRSWFKYKIIFNSNNK